MNVEVKAAYFPVLKSLVFRQDVSDMDEEPEEALEAAPKKENTSKNRKKKGKNAAPTKETPTAKSPKGKKRNPPAEKPKQKKKKQK